MLFPRRVIVLYDLPRPLDNALYIRRDGLYIVSLMSRRFVVCGYDALGVIVHVSHLLNTSTVK